MLLTFNPRRAQLLAFFIIGFIAGGTILNIVMGHHLDQLNLENQELKDDLETTKSELEELRQNLADRSSQVITGIEVQVDFSKSDYLPYEKDSLQLTLEKKVAELLEPLRGQKISDLEPLVVSKILDQRILEVEDKRFNLDLKLLVLTENVKAFVIAVPQTTLQEEKAGK